MNTGEWRWRAVAAALYGAVFFLVLTYLEGRQKRDGEEDEYRA